MNDRIERAQRDAEMQRLNAGRSEGAIGNESLDGLLWRYEEGRIIGRRRNKVIAGRNAKIALKPGPGT